MRKILVSLLFFLLLAASPLLADVAGKTFVNGYGPYLPPFAYHDHHGVATGFDIEALNWIANKMGFKVRHEAVEWTKIIDRLREKKIDLIASGLSVTPERANVIKFTRPYWQVYQLVLVRSDSTLSAADILTGGSKIGVMAGTSEAQAMEKAKNQNGRNYTLSTYASAALAASDVVNGRIAATVLNTVSAGEVIKHLAVKVAGSAGIPSEEYAYGVNPENQELLEALNLGLELLTQDPYWWTLQEKYSPGVSPEQYNPNQ
ncbi:MAG: ABC transporter substrate-binding protein [Deltaproteobacteria bacterium]|jgi:polar amino acid transport system substrate-binding protein|nr:ABC transporter substrate-binding protein [Deltaproteobacteria bacterium]